MILRPPRSTRTATRFPDTTLVRSALWRGERRRKRPWPVFPYLSRPASATYGHDPPYSRRSARRMRRRGGIPFSRSVRRAGAENRTSLSSRTFAEAVSVTAGCSPVSGGRGRGSEERRLGEECVGRVRYRGWP